MLYIFGECTPYYTMRSSTRVFDFPRLFLAFFLRFMIPSYRYPKRKKKRKKNARKTIEKSKTRVQREERYTILHYALGKSVSQLRFACVLLAFCLRFACVLLAFCSRFTRVLLAFCSRFARVLLINLTKTETTDSVIWPLIVGYIFFSLF